MNAPTKSILKRLFSEQAFVDLYQSRPKEAVDVIIPLAHSNELWQVNLFSIYREIPVNRLLIGNANCDPSFVHVAQGFPRVEIFDHSEHRSLGYSIRKLIEEVKTEWFIYLHSDVYLPAGWFEKMAEHKSQYDWFECRQHLTVLIDFPLDYTPVFRQRPFSGAQMGRKTAFKKLLPKIEDDYLLRNEDIIIAGMLENEGFRYGRADDLIHYHQVMQRPGHLQLRKIKSVDVQFDLSKEEEIRTSTMQAKGIIKYLQPTPWLIGEVQASLDNLQRLKVLCKAEFKEWVRSTNPSWLPYLFKSASFKRRFRNFLSAFYHLIAG